MPEMLIGGEWREASAHEQLEVVNPATEEIVDTVPAGSPEDVELAVATAKRAFPEWSRTDVEKRAAILAKAADLIHEHAKDLAAKLTVRAGQAAGRGDGRGQPSRAWRALLRRGGDEGARGLSGPSEHAGALLRDGDPPSDGRLRGDHALQLPADAARDQGRAGAGEREHGRGQAGRHHSAGHARGGAAVLRGRRPRRRAQRGHRPRRGDRRCPRRPSRRAPRRLHRLDRGRAPRGQARRARSQAPLARARRLRSR